jgi:hypothetical protein
MIPFTVDISQLQASSLSRRVEEAYEPVGSQVEMRAPERVVATNVDPVAEWTVVGAQSGASFSGLELAMPELEWTPSHEKKFLQLAGREATGELTGDETSELERLSQMRRGLKNPRSGEELLWEYQQRELTRDLISALSRYVTFHNPPSYPAAAEA